VTGRKGGGGHCIPPDTIIGDRMSDLMSHDINPTVASHSCKQTTTKPAHASRLPCSQWITTGACVGPWQVTLVSADMRSWVAPEPADILVSELLGSFGDNELSPECLDGAQRFLAPGQLSGEQRCPMWSACQGDPKILCCMSHGCALCART
jgi:hypothetical protein